MREQIKTFSLGYIYKKDGVKISMTEKFQGRENAFVHMTGTQVKRPQGEKIGRQLRQECHVLLCRFLDTTLGF